MFNHASKILEDEMGTLLADAQDYLVILLINTTPMIDAEASVTTGT